MNFKTNYTQTIVASIAILTTITLLIAGGAVLHAALVWNER